MTKQELLAEIEKNIQICKKCGLCETAKNAVPGEGNSNAEIAFVGEAPGETEDNTGRPFVGRAGKLLEAILNKLGYKREDVWIGNIIKHRPPQNRDPFPDEIKACEGYLEAQLQAIKPVVVVTLGRFSMNYFYPEGKISQVHGTLIKTAKFPVYAMYHPAAALRATKVLEEFKKDFVRLPNILKAIKDGTIDAKPANPTHPSSPVTAPENSDDGQLGLF